MLRSALILSLLLGGLALFGNAARVACPTIGNAAVSQGWAAYHDGRLDEAHERFETAYRRCPEHEGALVGLGYVALRQELDDEAAAWFDRALSIRPRSVDALAGQGLLAWRSGDIERVHHFFARVLAIDADHAEARAFLDMLPEGFGDPPDRPPLVRPDTVEYLARTRGDRFEVRTTDGWQPFYVKGVNLGAALPGRWPSEFPDEATYADWLGSMADMGANTVRVYTIHPPAFYRALDELNAGRPDAPLRLIQGIWAELPPDHDFEDPGWFGALKGEIRDAVDAVHGRADIRPRRGHASGHYLADVSRWTLAFVLSREWEPFSVLEFNDLHPDRTEYEGRYLTMRGGSAMDAWLTSVADYIASYETEAYGQQRPLAYTTWPTLDPLTHETEASHAEEAEIRRGFGEVVNVLPRSHVHEEDVVSVDPSLVRPTEEFRGGWFAAYHAYPYYPDFMVLRPDFSRTSSPLGRSNYYGYLQELKRHHADIPVVIAEYGVPASLTNSHMQPQGWHHGGLDEEGMAQVAARMTQEIRMAGMAGGILFAWIDEWFKKNWLTQDFAIPAARNHLWLNVLDPEQMYGVLAKEPAPRLPEGGIARRWGAWADYPSLYESPAVRVKALADEALLHLFVEFDGGTAPDELFIGFDMGSPDAGSFRWPGGAGPNIPTGVDFVLRATRDDVRLMASPESNPIQLVPDTVGQALRGAPVAVPVEGAPPGFFHGRYVQQINYSQRAVRRTDGRFDPLLVLPNPLRFGRDGTEYLGMGYDRGILRPGSPPDGYWEWLADGSALEVRIPWMLLNITDPSSRRVVRPGARAEGREIGTATVDGIRVVVAARDVSDRWLALPASGNDADVTMFTWPTWDAPRWQARRRPVFEAMRETFRAMQTQLVSNE